MNQDQNQIPNSQNPTGGAAPVKRPVAARPAQPAGTQRPVAARPAQPAAAQRPVAARPAQPAAAQRPVAARPAQPAGAQRPVAARPAQPAGAQRPVAARPAQPAAAQRPAAARPAQPAPQQAASKAEAPKAAPQQPSSKAPAHHSKKKKRPVWVAPLIAGLSVIVLCAAVYLGVSIAAKPYFAAGTGVSDNSYTAASKEELVAYLSHPALMEGDTIAVAGNIEINIDEDFGGYLDLPLITFDCAGGSLSFTGGSCYIYGGYSESESFEGVSFTDTTLVIDAPEASLTWSAAPSDTSAISLGSLNGADCKKELSVLTQGRYVSVPVTVSNLTANVLTDVDVKLSAPGLVLVDGRTFTVDSVGVGESVSFNVTAICAEGGRHRISAAAFDEAGTAIISGGSGYISVMGEGYYAGDLHTHSVVSNGDREVAVRFSSLEQNISSAYEAGMSYIVSVEEDGFARQLSQSEVDALVGSTGSFLQIAGAEQGKGYEHLIFLNYPTDVELPSDAYGEIVNQMEWTVQAAIGEAVSNGATVIYPHALAAGDLLEQMYKMQNSYGVSAYEIMCRNHIFGDMSFTIAQNVWDMVNVQGRQKLYAVASSNNTTAEEVALNYTKGWMGDLSAESVTAMVKSGNSFSSNGPEMRFDVGGTPMGGEMDVAAGESVVLNFTVSDDVPLTGVKVFKYTITGRMDDLAPEMLLDLDLTGQGMLSYSASLENVVTDDCFYRVEVYSEVANRYDQYSSVGRGYTNPVWVNVTGGDSGNTSIASMTYEPKLTGIGFLDGICSAILGDFKSVELRYSDSGMRYIDATEGDFSLNGLAIDTKGSTLALNFHKGSEGSADFVTVRVGAPNGSYTVEKIYIAR